MNKRIALSALTIGAVLAAVTGATIAQFDDSEEVLGNTFTAGTIDIAVDDQNPWGRAEKFSLLDMKPSYTDYIDFVIQNVGTNPANVWKKVHVTETSQGTASEPECVAEGGTWNGASCDSGTPKHDIDTVIGYDLSVELYDPDGALVWWQMLYNDDISLADLAGIPAEGMYLGMIPAGWSLKVRQSYHMWADTGNWAQGDDMTFDIELYALQLTGSLVLENKNGAPDWDIDETDDVKGTLTYKVSHPTFDFDFTGKAPTGGATYALVIGDDPWFGGQTLGTATAAGDGTITVTGDVELGTNYDHAKVWLVLNSDWNEAGMTGWHEAQYLFETGLIEYRDTDL